MVLLKQSIEIEKLKHLHLIVSQSKRKTLINSRPRSAILLHVATGRHLRAVSVLEHSATGLYIVFVYWVHPWLPCSILVDSRKVWQHEYHLQISAPFFSHIVEQCYIAKMNSTVNAQVFSLKARHTWAGVVYCLTRHTIRVWHLSSVQCERCLPATLVTPSHVFHTNVPRRCHHFQTRRANWAGVSLAFEDLCMKQSITLCEELADHRALYSVCTSLASSTSCLSAPLAIATQVFTGCLTVYNHSFVQPSSPPCHITNHLWIFCFHHNAEDCASYCIQ